ncbi:MAG: Wzz/FepE/Etk N-terminal domain-containing protein [candidate division KSB1 bacterium]|jgi:uncharacterized protein involved in exopolysaccharide biosynthesis|nr:Wzz/FepE/Etk N-terminal domain-containing protein [candidate division KSB1 bacterium]
MQQNSEEIDIFDYLNVLLKKRWMILRNIGIAVVAAALISLILPKSYTARTSVLPPDESKEPGILSTLMGTSLGQLGLTQFTSTSDLFVQILKSRTVFDDVLQGEYQYGNEEPETLLTILNTQSLERGRRKLKKAVSIAATQEGVVNIRVELSHPRLAAEVANAFVAALDRVNMEKNTSRAKKSRIYIEDQLEITESKLKEASDALARFKEKYKAVALEEQTKTAIERAGEVKGNIIAKEVQLGVAQQTMKADNVYIIQLKKEIEELARQYNYLQYGDSLSLSEKEEFYIPFSQVPEVGLELAKLIRDAKIQETVWELLNQQYYQAKIQEAKDTPTVEVLDEAVPPEFKTKPKRTLIVLIAAFLTFLGSVFWAFAVELFTKLKKEPGAKEWEDTLKRDAAEIKSTFSDTLKKWRKRS